VILPARVLALLLPALVLCGCSGGVKENPPASGGPPPGPSRLVDERFVQWQVRKGLFALYVGDDKSPENREAGSCFAGALMTSNHPEELRDARILDAEYAVVKELPSFDREGAELWVDAQFACVDFVAESARAQVAATKGKVDRAAYETCLRDALSEDQLREAAIESVMGDLGGEAVTALSQAQLACVQDALPPD
jgi:hypothetical protein